MKISLDLTNEQISSLLEQVFKSGLYGVSLTQTSLAKSTHSRKNAVDGFSPKNREQEASPAKKIKKLPNLTSIVPKKTKKTATSSTPKYKSRFPRNLVELAVEEYLKDLPLNSSFSWGNVLSYVKSQEISFSNGTLASALNYLVKRKVLHKPRKGIYIKDAEIEGKSSFKTSVKAKSNESSMGEELSQLG